MADYQPKNPFIVQGDHTILVEVASPRYGEGRDRLTGFAELVKSPQHIHTYRITPLSIWNACAARVDPDWIVDSLESFSKYPVPGHIVHEIYDFAARYGRLSLESDDLGIVLQADEPSLALEIAHQLKVAPFLGERLSETSFRIAPANRGRLKQALIKVGFPARDLAGYRLGEPVPFRLRDRTLAGRPFQLRAYQSLAADSFHAGGSPEGGSGVIVLPCGAGKTIVALAAMARVRTSTLILCTGVTAVRQWISELLDKTTLTEEQIGEYSGHAKQVRPVTVSTYNIMTYRRPGQDGFVHMDLFDRRNWGLIVYDEVHLLPAPVFQATASLQARRRLGLTATLVREDGREDDVFALIGPKKSDVPWRELEDEGWIAAAGCREMRVPLPKSLRMPYATANNRKKFRIASENPAKTAIVSSLLHEHSRDQVLIIGTYLDQLRELSGRFGIPLLTGSTPQAKRDELFSAFRRGALRTLAVSKVANFSVDLPDASVAIQISGTFGSRQEEAQRLGRILRPKKGSNRAHFYTLVSRDTVEQDFALRRQLFLCEQGYEYRISEVEPAAPSTEKTVEAL